MKKTTAMQIADEISTRIAKGQLHPGERLVETALAEEFQTSRAPIREALLMLERDRLVDRIPHQGVVVRRFTRQEIYELYDVIYRLEEIAFEKAVSKVTEEDLRELDRILEDQKKAQRNQNIESYYELNEEFHNKMIEITGNKILLNMYQSLRRPARPFRMMSMAQGNNMYSSYKEHKKQVEALRQRSVSSGKRAIREQEIRSLQSLDILFPV